MDAEFVQPINNQCHSFWDKSLLVGIFYPDDEYSLWTRLVSKMTIDQCLKDRSNMQKPRRARRNTRDDRSCRTSWVARHDLVEGESIREQER